MTKSAQNVLTSKTRVLQDSYRFFPLKNTYTVPAVEAATGPTVAATGRIQSLAQRGIVGLLMMMLLICAVVVAGC